MSPNMIRVAIVGLANITTAHVLDRENPVNAQPGMNTIQ
jgi:hypothetical protein